MANKRGGGGPTRQPQHARRATAAVNQRGPEQATARTGGARGARGPGGRGAGHAERAARGARSGQGTRSGPSRWTGARFIALPLKTVHDEILAQC